MQSHQGEFRRFVQEDLGIVIASQISHFMQSHQRSDTPSSHSTSVFVPPAQQRQQEDQQAAAAAQQAVAHKPVVQPVQAQAQPVLRPPPPPPRPMPTPDITAPADSLPPPIREATIIVDQDADSLATTTTSGTNIDLPSLIKGIAKAVQPKEKLILPKLQKSHKSAYISWLKETLLTIKLHPSFAKYVQKSIKRGTYIMDSLTTPLRGTLYMSLSKALDSSVKSDIGWGDTEESDGIAIFA